MQYKEFMGQVQARAQLGTEEEAVKVTRTVLETLAERLFNNEAEHLAAQLPEEIGRFLTESADKYKYTLDEFFDRIAEKEDVRKPTAIYHARVVLEVLREAVSFGELEDVLSQLPEEFDELMLAGSQGELDLPR